MRLSKKFLLRLLAVVMVLTCLCAVPVQAADYVAGDIDGNGKTDQEDVAYLLLYTMYGESRYPLNSAPAETDQNGTVNQDDAVYLLLYIMFGETFYPLPGEEAPPIPGVNGTPIC